MLKVGDRVKANDPTWVYHGIEGTVLKVNKKTVRVQIGTLHDGHPETALGSPVYWEKI